MEVLLTNDDGYGSPGIRAIAEGLGDADVTVVAPTEDQSSTGRTYSEEIVVEERPLGFAVSGTPVDCVVIGLDALDLSPDIVISGCNIGANVGRHVLGRSGTISAAVEATFFGRPAMAVSLYIPEDEWPREPTLGDFREAINAVQYLAERTATDDMLPSGHYLNVNVPTPAAEPAPMRLTRPSTQYAMSAHRNGDTIDVVDRTWAETSETADNASIDTDRSAVKQGYVSVSPLDPTHWTAQIEAFEDVIAGYGSEATPGARD